MTPTQIEELKKLAEAAMKMPHWYFKVELEKDCTLEYDDIDFVIAASPNVVLALLQENEAQAARIKELAVMAVSEFDTDHPPTFRQGVPVHELEEAVTAERCTGLAGLITTLRAQLAALQGDGELPELPDYDIETPDGFEWSSTAMQSYARQAVAMSRAKMVPLTDAELIRMAVNAGFGTYCEGYPDGVLWFDENPMELLKKVSAHGITGEPK